MNMIGRAGRAGYLSDGIGLIAQKNRGDAIKTLDKSRHYFFHQMEPSQENLGLSNLLLNCIKAKIDEGMYPLELGSLNFSEIQTLQSFVVQANIQGDDVESVIREEILAYPSVQELSAAEIQDSIIALSKFSNNLNALFSDSDPLLPSLMQRTGLPLEVLQVFIIEFRQLDLTAMAIQGEGGQLIWSDQVVRKGLEYCVYRDWYKGLIGNELDLDKMFTTIIAWRSGNPLASLERIWQANQSEKETRLQVGRFINHKLPLFTQFWGALAVCYEALYSSQQNDFAALLKAAPVFTREGVSSALQLHWLYALGKQDRVLAHELASIWQSMGRPQQSFHYLRGQLKRWFLEKEPWPTQISEEHKRVLRVIISELRY